MVRQAFRVARFAMVVAACAGCSRDLPTTASGASRAGIHLQAVMSTAATAPVSFNRARLVFRGALGGTALDTTFALADDGAQTALHLSVPLTQDVPLAGELFSVVLSCMTPAGDTVYRGGPAIVLMGPLNPSPVVNLVLRPTGTLLPGDSLPIVDSLPLLDSLPAVVDSTVALVVSAISGDGQSGLVGAVLGAPLRVLVTNRAAQPVPGVTIAWAAALGGGILSSPTSVTNASGIAQSTLHLGLIPGLNVVTATAGELAPVIFNLTGALGLGASRESDRVRLWQPPEDCALETARIEPEGIPHHREAILQAPGEQRQSIRERNGLLVEASLADGG